MTSNKIRKLTPSEMALVCGGSDMGTVTVTPDYGDWHDPSWYDPNYGDYPLIGGSGSGGSGDGGGDGGGGETTQTFEEMRDYLEGNPEFNELSDKLKILILQNDKLTIALNDMLMHGFKFEPTNVTSYTMGNTMFVNINVLAGSDPSDSALNMFFHEVGHYVKGIPMNGSFSDPNAYADARARAEVNADMYMVQVSKEVGITHYFLGTLTLEAANKVANGTFDSSDYQRAVNGNLVENPGLAASTPPDLNSDGKVNNTDLYLSQWRSSTGQTYSEWLQSHP